MSPYIADEIKVLCNNETDEGRVELLIGVREGKREQVVRDVYSLGGSDIERLPFNSITVSVPKSSISDICTLDGLESVELDEGVEVVNEK